MKHSRMSGSKAKRWINCPGSVTAPVPPGFDPDRSGDTEWAREGTAAHKLAEICLRKNTDPTAYLDMDVVGTGVYVTQEMADAVEVYLNAVKEEREEDSVAVHVEERVSLDGINPPEEMGGTPDVFMLHPLDEDRYKLTIMDLKYGSGVVVEPDDWQFRFYAVGLLTGQYALTPIEEVEVVVVQPRIVHPDGPVRRASYSRDEIMEFAKQIKTAAELAVGPNPPFAAGSWCQFCPSAPLCPELQREAERIAQEAFADKALPAPESLTPEQIGKTLNKAAVIEAWFKSLRAYAEQELLDGKIIPGLKLVEKRAQRRWTDSEQAFQKLIGKGYSAEELLEPAVLRSPAQIEKVIEKKDKEMLGTLTTKYKGVTLALASDRRPAVATSTDIFVETDE